MTELHWSNINPKTRNLIMLGLALGMFMACLDSTIVTTCAKTISESMKGSDLYSWIFTAYLLCETIMIPIAGKLSDKYGRKKLFLAGMAIFIIGSVLSANSGTMMQLIIFRAIQGIGGGILLPVATASVADLYAPEKRGKMQGALGGVFAIATVLGPTVGGMIADSIGWHWVFYMNIPFGIAAILMTLSKFPTVEAAPKKKTDFTGMALLGLILVDVLLLFTWGGTDFPWISVNTLVMAAIAIVLTAVFVYNEHKVSDPVLALHLFKSKTFVYCSIGLMILSVGMMGVMTYMSMFLQLVMGYTATMSGIIMISLVAGLMITSSASGILLPRTGGRFWVIVGPIVTAFGMLLLSTVHAGTSLYVLLIYLFITGLGIGCLMSVFMTMVQNDSREDEMGMSTSGASLFRSIGGTIATGLFATLINSKLSSGLASALPSDMYNTLPHDTGILDFLGEMGAYAQNVITAYGDSISFALIVAAFIILAVAVLGLVMKEKRKQKGVTAVQAS